MKKVLFVCLGNICRSPAAEGVFIHLVNEAGLSEHFRIDSAGTSSFHVGERADSRMLDHASRRGIDLPSRSRQFVKEDFQNFDYIIAMDRSNHRNILGVSNSSEDHKKVFMMSDFKIAREEIDVPDPYYGGAAGFEEVLDIVTDGSKGLFLRIKKELEL